MRTQLAVFHQSEKMRTPQLLLLLLLLYLPPLILLDARRACPPGCPHILYPLPPLRPSRSRWDPQGFLLFMSYRMDRIFSCPRSPLVHGRLLAPHPVPSICLCWWCSIAGIISSRWCEEDMECSSTAFCKRGEEAVDHACFFVKHLCFLDPW